MLWRFNWPVEYELSHPYRHIGLQGVLRVAQASWIRIGSPCSPTKGFNSLSTIRHKWLPRLQNKANLRDLIAATGLVNFDAKIDVRLAFFAHVTLRLDWWHRKTMGQLLYPPPLSSFVHHFIAIVDFKLELSLWISEIGVKLGNFFGLCDRHIWQMTLKSDRSHLLYPSKLFAW